MRFCETHMAAINTVVAMVKCKQNMLMLRKKYPDYLKLNLINGSVYATPFFCTSLDHMV